jgi:O-acetyl-ADP-ribose deacetylase (regulator of RNase III)
VTAVRLHFVDADPGVAGAIGDAFRGFPEVTCARGDILALAHNAVVSPANSYGFMDGGIDAAYSDFFGAGVQRAVQEAINRRPEGHLPIGASLAVRTGHARIPFLIVAPTMQTPEAVPPSNCYRALRAILRLATGDAAIGQDIFCPGLATGIGRVTPERAAEELARAYEDWIAGRAAGAGP